MSSFFSVKLMIAVSEIILIGLLLIGLMTFDLKMIRYYLTSFDSIYKLVNWSLYVVADIIWNGAQRDMDAFDWLQCISLDIIFTSLVVYVVLIDSYQISHKSKTRAMSVSILISVYGQMCILSQVYALNPNENWEDNEVLLPVMKIWLSMRALMVTSLGNCIIFLVKQLALTVRYPNCCALPVYPKIDWVDRTV